MAPLALSNDNDVQVNIAAIKADYETTIDEVRIETGVKYSDVVTDNATVFMQQVNEGWQMDHSLSNLSKRLSSPTKSLTFSAIFRSIENNYQLTR